MIKRIDAKALYCWGCKRPLPATQFAVRNKRNDRGYAYKTRRYYCNHCHLYIGHGHYVPKAPCVLQCPHCGIYFLSSEGHGWDQTYCTPNCQRISLHLRTYVPKEPKPRQISFLSKAECLPCTKCGSIGPKYKNDFWCRECAKKAAKNRRERQKNEDPVWHAKEIARLRKWREDHPGQSKGSKKRPRREGDYLPIKHWITIEDAFSQCCAYCGISYEELLLVDRHPNGLLRDHVVPYSKGGLLRIDNIVPACPDCNLDKLAKDMRDYVNDECLYESIMVGMGDAEYDLRAREI